MPEEHMSESIILNITSNAHMHHYHSVVLRDTNWI